MPKFLHDFLDEPSNVLFSFTQEFIEQPIEQTIELEFGGRTNVQSNWLRGPGSGDASIVFPDGTRLQGSFNGFSLESGTIKFPSGVTFQGKFERNRKFVVGLFQKGIIRFPDNSYLQVECEGLRLVKAQLFNSVGESQLIIDGFDVIHFREPGSLFVKKFDLRNFTLSKVTSENQKELIEENVYSYFGLYQSTKSFIAFDSDFFKKFGDQVAREERAFPADLEDAIRWVENTSKFSNKMLTFSLKNFPGFIMMKVDDIKNPNYGKGYFKNGSFKAPLQMIVIESSLRFILAGRLYDIEQIKQAILRLMQQFSTEQNEAFIEISDDDTEGAEPTLLAQSLLSKPSEEQYRILLTEMVEKYELAQRINEHEKSRLNSELTILINKNLHLERANEKLTQMLNNTHLSMKHLTGELNDCNGLINKKNEAIDRLRGEVVNRSKEFSRVERINENLKQIYDQKEKEFMTLIKDFASIKNNFNEELRVLREKNTLLGDENRELKSQILKADDQIDYLNQQNLALNSRIESFENMEDHLLIGLEQTRNEFESLGSNYNKLMIEKQCLYNELKKLAEFGKSQQFKVQQLEAELEAKLKVVHEQSSQSEFLHQADVMDSESSNQIIDFTGKIVNGKKEGPGYLKTRDFVFEGSFKNDKFFGKGKLTLTRNNKVLEGEFDADGNFKGSMLRIGSVEYHGPIVRNQMEGKGVLNFKNGFMVEGHFKKDNFDGSQPYEITDLNEGTEDLAYVQPSKNYLVSINNGLFKIDFESGELKKID